MTHVRALTQQSPTKCTNGTTLSTSRTTLRPTDHVVQSNIMLFRRYALAQTSLADPVPPHVSTPLSSNLPTRIATTNLQSNSSEHSSPFDWAPFNFLRDGTRSLRNGTSKLFGGKGQTSILAPQKAAGGLFGSSDEQPEPDEDASDATAPTPAEQPTTRKHSFPSWSTWKDWKKISLDFYVRLVDRPKDTRVRLKQTVAVLPIFKLKPVIDFTYRGPNQPPVSMHLDVKLLDCFKYRLRQDGSSTFQVRAKAPLSDPRFLIDVVYERDLQTAEESVKISLRALEVAFLKAPGFGTGVKFPIRFDNGIKSTIRVKKYLTVNGQVGNATLGNQPLLAGNVEQSANGRKRRFGRSSLRSNETPRKPQLGVVGPSGVDLKVRCLEYR